MKKAKLKYLFRAVASSRVTLVCFLLGFILLFIGTFYEAKWGSRAAVTQVFRAFFIYWHPAGFFVALPIFPGGYFLGLALLLNLLLAFPLYFSGKKLGLFFFHAGVLLFISGEFLSGLFSSETTLILGEGEKVAHALDLRETELVIQESQSAKEWIFDGRKALKGNVLDAPDLPFILRVANRAKNATITEQDRLPEDRNLNVADIGAGSAMFVYEQPASYRDEDFNYLTVWVDILTSRKRVGTLLLSTAIDTEEVVYCDGKNYSFILRPKRDPLPFRIELTKFSYEYYPGTEIPKNFTSFVKFLSLEDDPDYETLITMNNPVSYRGVTLFQRQIDPEEKKSILQVVRNPAWGFVYLASLLVVVGLILHAFKRRFI